MAYEVYQRPHVVKGGTFDPERGTYQVIKGLKLYIQEDCAIIRISRSDDSGSLIVQNPHVYTFQAPTADRPGRLKMPPSVSERRLAVL